MDACVIASFNCASLCHSGAKLKLAATHDSILLTTQEVMLVLERLPPPPQPPPAMLPQLPPPPPRAHSNIDSSNHSRVPSVRSSDDTDASWLVWFKAATQASRQCSVYNSTYIMTRWQSYYENSCKLVGIVRTKKIWTQASGCRDFCESCVWLWEYGVCFYVIIMLHTTYSQHTRHNSTPSIHFVHPLRAHSTFPHVSRPTNHPLSIHTHHSTHSPTHTPTPIVVVLCVILCIYVRSANKNTHWNQTY